MVVIRKIRQWLESTLAGTRRGIEDVIVSMVPQGVAVLTGFLTSVLIARGLGPKGMGSYALIQSVCGLAAGLSDLGIGQTAIRFASLAAECNDKDRQFRILRWAFRLRMSLVFLVSGIVFGIIPVIAERVWNDPTLTPLVRLSLLTGVFTAFAAVPTIYFQSLKRFKMNAAVSVGETLVSFLGILILAVARLWSLDMVIAVSVVATGLSAAAFAILVPKETFLVVPEFRRPSWSIFNRLWRAPRHDEHSPDALDRTGPNTFAFYMLLASVAVTVTMRADVWLMGMYLDKSQIGLYSVATRFTLPLVIVLSALTTALWPRASALTSLERTRDMVAKTFRLSVLVALPCVVYSLAAPFATPYIFGSAYGGGILLAQILCLRYCLSILICPIGVIGYSFGLVRVYWLINVLQLVAVVGIDLFLLPRIGVMGAAIALIANELIGCILSAGIIWRKLRPVSAR